MSWSFRAAGSSRCFQYSEFFRCSRCSPLVSLCGETCRWLRPVRRCPCPPWPWCERSAASSRRVIGRQLQHRLKLLLQRGRRLRVGFVQHKNIRHLHQAGFHILHVVAQARHDKHERAFGEPHDVDLVLAHADGFNQHISACPRHRAPGPRRRWRARGRQEIRAWPWSE